MTTRRILIVCAIASAGRPGMAQSDSDSFSLALSAGFGIDLVASSSLADYVNAVAQPPERVDEFGSAVEFAAASDVRVSERWSTGIDYNYLIRSFAVTGAGGGSKFSHTVHLPFLVVHYLIPLRQSRIRLGGGIGMAFASLEEALYGSTTGRTYTAKGGGLKLEAVGSSKLDDHFYGVLAVDLRWIFGSPLRDGTGEARLGNVVADAGYFSAGVKFGVEFAW